MRRFLALFGTSMAILWFGGATEAAVPQARKHHPARAHAKPAPAAKFVITVPRVPVAMPMPVYWAPAPSWPTYYPSYYPTYSRTIPLNIRITPAQRKR